MVVLGRIECVEFSDFGDDWVGEDFLVGELLDHVFGGLFFFFSSVENCGTVLGAAVVALAVEGCGVVGCKENMEYVGIRDGGGVVIDFDGFGVTGGS